MRLFVKIRIPRVKQVHICIDGEGEYVAGRTARLLRALFGGRIDKDDALLSTLVNIAPPSIGYTTASAFSTGVSSNDQDVFGAALSSLKI